MSKNAMPSESVCLRSPPFVSSVLGFVSPAADSIRIQQAYDNDIP